MATGPRSTVRRTQPDDGATLADGVVVDLFLTARVLGWRLLSLDGRVVLSPAVARTLDPVMPATVPRRSTPGPESVETPQADPDASAPDPEVGPSDTSDPSRRPRLAVLRRRVEDNSRRLRTRGPAMVDGVDID